MKLTGKKLRRLARLPVFSLLVVFVYTSSAVAQAPGAFIATGNMSTPRVGHTATLLPNGKVLITGGADHNRALVTAELFDPETATFNPTGNMTMPRAFHSAILLPDGRVLIAGGGDSSAGPLQASAEIYDPSTGTFTRTGNMVVPQMFAAATLLNNGKVFISGPCTDAVPDLFCCRPQLYNPVTGAFSTAGEGENSERYPDLDCGAALLPNGKVLIGSPPELYDPATDTVSLAGQRITIGFYGITATLLTNGRVLIAGGASDFGLSANGELYDPVTEKFTAAGNMSHNRFDHTATLLRDGTVLIAGGLFNSNTSSNAEIYDAATGTFASTGDMAVPRADHTATLLRDGRILIAGGTSRDFPSAELYVPNVLIPAQVVSNLSFEGTSVVAGSSFSANFSGSNVTPQTFFDVRFSAPGSDASDVVLNWQRGTAASHIVPAGTASGTWTINGVRAHKIETDHTGSFIPVNATITVSP